MARITILSFDLSLTNSGWAVGVLEDEQLKIIDRGSIGTKRFTKRSTGFRLSYIAEELKKLYEKYKPDAVIKERSFSNSKITATQQIFKVNGVWELITHQYDLSDFAEVAPTTVKKQVTGNGKAKKVDVKKAVKHITGIDEKDEDINDAIAVMYAYCYKEGLI